jgi:hypothetical protein
MGTKPAIRSLTQVQIEILASCWENKGPSCISCKWLCVSLLFNPHYNSKIRHGLNRYQGGTLQYFTLPHLSYWTLIGLLGLSLLYWTLL